MRTACTNYLDRIQYPEQPGKLLWVNNFTWLGELRGMMGSQIAQLSAMYGIDLEGNIVKILPQNETEIYSLLALGIGLALALGLAAGLALARREHPPRP